MSNLCVRIDFNQFYLSEQSLNDNDHPPSSSSTQDDLEGEMKTPIKKKEEQIMFG